MTKSSGRTADVLAAIILGALCFACAFGAVFLLTFRIWVRLGDPGSSEFPTILWLVPAVAGTIAAILGPLLLKNPYSSSTSSLAETRARSKHRGSGRG